MSSHAFLITGATGKQGGAVINSLLAEKAKGSNISIRALTRNLEAPASLRLKERGVELVKGGYSDPDALETALRGVDAAFLVTVPNFKEEEFEVAQGRAFVEAALKAKLPYLVFTSVEPAGYSSGVGHFDSKGKIERMIEQKGIPHTLLRPVAFMDNLPKQRSLITFGGIGFFATALRGNPTQWVSCKDIGIIGAQCLMNPEKYKSRAIALAGEEMTAEQVQDAYERAQGTRPWKAWLPELVLRAVPKDISDMFLFLSKGGYKVDIAELRKEFPHMQTFEQWLRDTDPE